MSEFNNTLTVKQLKEMIKDKSDDYEIEFYIFGEDERGVEDICLLNPRDICTGEDIELGFDLAKFNRYGYYPRTIYCKEQEEVNSLMNLDSIEKLRQECIRERKHFINNLEEVSDEV